MDDAYDEERYDSVYANDPVSEFLNVTENLKQTNLDQLLEEDKRVNANKDDPISWYHGKIPREAAESILKEGLASLQGSTTDSNGLYLIRDSTSSEKDFVVSVTHDAKVFHFQIKEVFDGHYKLDEGPTTQGLEKLVAYYENGANGLITKLTRHCKGSPPPDRARLNGPTNLLHRAVMEGNEETVTSILQHRLCPSINAKNDLGTTALHDAAKYGRVSIAKKLIDKGADVHAKDRAGFTPLHRACSANYPDVVAVLIKHGKADPQIRSPKTGWVALHEAAMKGNAECIRKLLQFHAPMMPRADDGQTPLDLALRYNRQDCIPLLRFPDRREVRTKKEYWYHSDLDRKLATQMLEEYRKEEGLFLVRKSTRNENYNVISLCHKKSIFNFEIKVKDYENQLVHYIDDGPYFESLQQLIEHYSRYCDGLSTKLRASISTDDRRIEVDEEYYNVHDVNNVSRRISSPGTAPPVPNPRPVLPAHPNHPSNKQQEEYYADPSNEPPPLPPSHPPAKPSTASIKGGMGERQSSLDEFKKIDKKDIKVGSELGQGEFGAVKKGIYTQRKAKFRSMQIEVALKTFHDESMTGALASIMEEARLMQRLDHECIVKLYGICEKPFMLVEEYISKGSLLDYLIDHRNQIEANPTMYLWASQVANGMCYLETMKIVHRDLAARNILVQNLEQVKISDFGLSRAFAEEKNYYQASKGGRWPIKWYAPECVNYGKFNHKTDVWSFGITLWEMFSYGDQPYGDKKGVEVMQFIESGERLSKPDDCPETCYKKMRECWNKDPAKRPDFKDLYRHFQMDQEYACVSELMAKRNKSRKN
ncbi:tyrosine-protein kinase HTK16-like [Saccostrea echinata]|uniref:tyrosine-protein kinase HTK16-like n=1 Tax=Saccostrea echinata TaxID=191078 RepID=UPI002A807FE5|nr:tyrosine-protein kinase HTK16-like [Saccostrea echinata]